MAEASGRFAGFGIGLRPPHYDDVLKQHEQIDFVEVISENFMVDGGKPLWVLDQVRERLPIALHGVSMGALSATDAVLLDGFDDKANVLGVKGIGELGVCGAAACDGFSHSRASQGVTTKAMASDSSIPMLALMGIGLMYGPIRPRTNAMGRIAAMTVNWVSNSLSASAAPTAATGCSMWCVATPRTLSASTKSSGPGVWWTRS